MEVKRVNESRSYIVDLPDSNSKVLPKGIRYILEGVIIQNNKNPQELGILEASRVANRLEEGVVLIQKYINHLNNHVDYLTKRNNGQYKSLW